MLEAISENQLSTISKQDILDGKEDEVVQEIVAGRVEGAQAISNIIFSKQNLNYMINKDTSDSSASSRKYGT